MFFLHMILYRVEVVLFFKNILFIALYLIFIYVSMPCADISVAHIFNHDLSWNMIKKELKQLSLSIF